MAEFGAAVVKAGAGLILWSLWMDESSAGHKEDCYTVVEPASNKGVNQDFSMK